MEEQYIESRDRLLYVIRLSGLNGKDFAAKVNVSPSTISQITSTSDKARKTGLSEMVVNRILLAFPQFNLSYEWLLNGIGPRTVQQKQPSLFDQVNDDPIQFTHAADSAHQSANEPEDSASAKPVPPNDVNNVGSQSNADASNLQRVTPMQQVNGGSSIHQEPQESTAGTPTPNDFTFPQPQADAQHSDGADHHSATPNGPIPSVKDIFPISQPGVSVERIVIFYSDGTFADYSPRRRQ